LTIYRATYVFTVLIENESDAEADQKLAVENFGQLVKNRIYTISQVRRTAFEGFSKELLPDVLVAFGRQGLISGHIGRAPLKEYGIFDDLDLVRQHHEIDGGWVHTMDDSSKCLYLLTDDEDTVRNLRGLAFIERCERQQCWIEYDLPAPESAS
jgi:hypothetical protein